MQKEPINTAPISQFSSLVKAAEISKQREVRMDIDTAKKLNYCLTDVLARLTQDLETLLITKSAADNEPIINIKMDGGTDW